MVLCAQYSILPSNGIGGGAGACGLGVAAMGRDSLNKSKVMKNNI